MTFHVGENVRQMEFAEKTVGVYQGNGRLRAGEGPEIGLWS